MFDPNMPITNNMPMDGYNNYYNNLRRPPVQNFEEGGMVEEPKTSKKEKNNIYPSLAEMIRQQGNGEDSILAHINPLEAMMLKGFGGSGKINPITGLPQFGFLKNPFKAIKSILGGVGGSIIGNMIMPGLVGIAGGAIGNAAGSALRGRKDYGMSALKGGLMGAALPSIASFAGSGANALGMEGTGKYLTDYGNNNAILPAWDKFTGKQVAGQNTGDPIANSLLNDSSEKVKSKSWMDSLLKPKNLLTGATLAGSFLNRPKEKSPERLAQEQKRFDKASILTPEERIAKESELLAEEQMRRRVARNKYLPEERFDVRPLYRSVNSPDEYARTGKWINYHNNPLLMKMGGKVPEMSYETEEIDYPSGLGVYLQGHTNGQDDKVNARLSHGEFIIPADVVADAGDGNNAAGGKAFEMLIKNIRKHKGRNNKLPPKAKLLSDYMK